MIEPRRTTPAQTIGPFFGYALPFEHGYQLVPPGRNDAIRLHGTVLDGEGATVPDALLEIWQTDSNGAVAQQTGSLHRDGWTFTGFGRTATDRSGHYTFTTVRPGANTDRAPFFAITLFARGLMDRLFTRAYLPCDPEILEADPFLGSIPPARRGTLVATPDAQGFVFNIRLQGEDETVFLRYGDGTDI